MMGVRAAQIVDVQGRMRVIDESLKELVYEVHVELPDPGANELDVEMQARTSGEIDHDARERFVQRYIRVTVGTPEENAAFLQALAAARTV